MSSQKGHFFMTETVYQKFTHPTPLALTDSRNVITTNAILHSTFLLRAKAQNTERNDS